MKRGHEMIVEHHPPFMRSQLDQLELNMLNATTVPQLLPLDWEERDGQLSFHYSIQELKMLSHFYQQSSISMQSYYSLLLSLTDALISCREYMLRPECCLLSEQYIFIEPKASTIRLAYLPMKEWANMQAIKEGDLLLIAVRWSAYVNDLEYTGFQRILQLLSSHKMPLIELRQLLLSFIGEHGEEQLLQSRDSIGQQQAKESGKAEQQDENFANISSAFSANRRKINFAFPESLATPAAEPVQAKQFPEEASLPNDNESWDDAMDDETEGKSRFSMRSILIIAITILAIIAVWSRLYVAEASQKSLLLCSGITLILLAIAGIIVGKQWRAILFEKEMKEDQSFDFYTQPAILSATAKQDTNEQHNMLRNVTLMHQPPATVLLNADEATAYIGKSNAMGEVQLIRAWNNEEEVIPLDHSPFLIGRSENGVHYQETAAGISRVHLECELGESGIKIKDLGSKNGTHINGKLMVAYKPYSFVAGDVVQLSDNNGPQYRLKLI